MSNFGGLENTANPEWDGRTREEEIAWRKEMLAKGDLAWLKEMLAKLVKWQAQEKKELEEARLDYGDPRDDPAVRGGSGGAAAGPRE
ncbi:unnamed protein product [Linum trigynum]|uniref:Uncharacterized protein n=1 Tax=Linum trigynum TaxID=586398 RepID=A0AAV2GWZ0_9ROSI